MNFVLAIIAIVALVAVGLTLALRSTGLHQRIWSIFRRPEPPAKVAGNEQYYRPYWSR